MRFDLNTPMSTEHSKSRRPATGRRSLLGVAFLLFGVSALTLSCGCADRPELSPRAYGTVVTELPYLEEAKETFPFPHAGDTDHSNCVFNEEDFF